MKTMILIVIIAVMSLGAASLQQDMPHKLLSFGAPVSSTGAPDERTCATSGCHDTYAPNIGRGSMNISIDGAENGFEAGKTYDITIQVADKDTKRFGYQLVALNDDDKTNAGELKIIDNDRTQIVTNDLKFKDRKYATYTLAGTEPFSDGLGYWKVKWTAPTSQKNITFYAATVIANNDDTDYGDYVLTSSLPLSPKSPSVVSEQLVQPAWISLQVIAGNSLNCRITLNKPDEISLELCDISGKVVPLGKRHYGAGSSVGEYKLSGFTAGAYFVRAYSSVGVFSHTVFIQ